MNNMTNNIGNNNVQIPNKKNIILGNMKKIINEIDIIDKKIYQRHQQNINELAFYNDILDNSLLKYHNILKNLSN